MFFGSYETLHFAFASPFCPVPNHPEPRTPNPEFPGFRRGRAPRELCFSREMLLDCGTKLNSATVFLWGRRQYLGGMFDLTGELNRFAVARATERDTQGVRECLETVMVVSRKPRCHVLCLAIKLGV